MAYATFDKAASILRSRPILTGISTLTILGAVWTINDYAEWKASGTGPLSPTWIGYGKMIMIRIYCTLSTNDPLDLTALSRNGPSYLPSPLSKRAGSRPKIMARKIPQRQVPGPIDPETKARLQTLVRDIASAHPDILEAKPSYSESKSADGLYAKKDISTLNPVARDWLLDHEIAHVHPVDNSLHVWLSEPDARAVIEAGWGQRFPLNFVNKGWIMVYAPRSMDELEVVERVVKAGVEWITGVEI